MVTLYNKTKEEKKGEGFMLGSVANYYKPSGLRHYFLSHSSVGQTFRHSMIDISS